METLEQFYRRVMIESFALVDSSVVKFNPICHEKLNVSFRNVAVRAKYFFAIRSFLGVQKKGVQQTFLYNLGAGLKDETAILKEVYYPSLEQLIKALNASTSKNKVQL